MQVNKSIRNYTYQSDWRGVEDSCAGTIDRAVSLAALQKHTPKKHTRVSSGR